MLDEMKIVLMLMGYKEMFPKSYISKPYRINIFPNSKQYTIEDGHKGGFFLHIAIVVYSSCLNEFDLLELFKRNLSQL